MFGKKRLTVGRIDEVGGERERERPIRGDYRQVGETKGKEKEEVRKKETRRVKWVVQLPYGFALTRSTCNR